MRIPANEITYIVAAVRGIDWVIRVWVVWRGLGEGSGSPSGGERTRGRNVTQAMEHATKRWEDAGHFLGLSVGVRSRGEAE